MRNSERTASSANTISERPVHEKPLRNLGRGQVRLSLSGRQIAWTGTSSVLPCEVSLQRFAVGGRAERSPQSSHRSEDPRRLALRTRYGPFLRPFDTVGDHPGSADRTDSTKLCHC